MGCCCFEELIRRSLLWKNKNGEEQQLWKLKGRVVIVTNNIRVEEFLEKRVSFQLISASHADPAEREMRGKVGEVAFLERWLGMESVGKKKEEKEVSLNVVFYWEVKSMGEPGALLVRNHHYKSQFYLKTVTIDEVPGLGSLHFICNSWVYPDRLYHYSPRLFFSNKAYLPAEMPAPLRRYREEELKKVRGSGRGELKEWDRVYDYALYNDLGLPDKGPHHSRPVMGGSIQHPYPRRCRTSRPSTKTDPKTESRLPLLSLDIYVPSDERFSHLKLSDSLGDGLRSLVQVLLPEIASFYNKSSQEFRSFDDVMKLYQQGLRLPPSTLSPPLDFFHKFLHYDDADGFMKFPIPDVIKGDCMAWRSDQEFAREMLAGLNPVVIRRLHEFPPTSRLDAQEYGNQKSSMVKEDIENSLDGQRVEEAIEGCRLFILDYHDILIPYLRQINSTDTKAYASRTLLFLKDDGTLKPVAIELSLPHPQGDSHGSISKVFTPALGPGLSSSLWQLAKAYVTVNDSGYHQLISHWLHTHAAMEPFVIATHRQLSTVHPLHKLLHPHFRDTMNINAFARQLLLNAGGLFEQTVFPSSFSLQLSSSIYKHWNFNDQALPSDLLKRGMAVRDEGAPHGLRLMIEDYPFAVDGLEVWGAIERWVEDYCCFYYRTDSCVSGDRELQSWWEEIREVGHGDKRDEPWWPTMKTRSELIRSCTTIIWVSSALHAAINFGQYPYGGYPPNRPAISRRLIPEPGTAEYVEVEREPELAFFKTITGHFQALVGISLIEILSTHSSEEVYLGQMETPGWWGDKDEVIIEAFERFRQRLLGIEVGIVERNGDQRLKNRMGPAGVAYTLLFPNTSDCWGQGGLTGKGIPNSITV